MGVGDDFFKRVPFEANAVDRWRSADEAAARSDAEAGAVDLRPRRRCAVDLEARDFGPVREGRGQGGLGPDVGPSFVPTPWARSTARSTGGESV